MSEEAVGRGAGLYPLRSYFCMSCLRICPHSYTTAFCKLLDFGKPANLRAKGGLLIFSQAASMTGRGGGRGKVLLPPINFIFKLLQQHSTVSIWLFEQLAIRIEGKIRVRI